MTIYKSAPIFSNYKNIHILSESDMASKVDCIMHAHYYIQTRPGILFNLLLSASVLVQLFLRYDIVSFLFSENLLFPLFLRRQSTVWTNSFCSDLLKILPFFWAIARLLQYCFSFSCFSDFYMEILNFFIQIIHL